MKVPILETPGFVFCIDFTSKHPQVRLKLNKRFAPAGVEEARPVIGDQWILIGHCPARNN